MTLHEFIRKRKYLIWWVKDYDKLKAESIVEATLNYGDWDDVQLLIRILGIKKVAKIFRAKSKPSKMGRQNYRSEVKHYFNLYFNREYIQRQRQEELAEFNQTWKPGRT